MKNHTKDLIIALPFSISFSRKGGKIHETIQTCSN